MSELPKEAQMSYQELFPEEFEQEELKSTLKAPERQVVWDHLEKMGHEIRNLKGIVQNPMPLTADVVREWSNDVNKLIDKLMKLDANVKKLIYTKGIDI